MIKNKKNDKVSFIIIFIVIFLLSIITLIIFLNYKKKLNIQYGEYLLDSEANTIQHAIDLRMLKLQTLEMVVVANENSVNNFDKIASELCIEDSSIQSLHIAPDGEVKYTYPTDIDSILISKLSLQLNAKENSTNSHNKEKMSLTGPVQIYDGQSNLVIKRPIMISNNEKSKNSVETNISTDINDEITNYINENSTNDNIIIDEDKDIRYLDNRNVDKLIINSKTEKENVSDIENNTDKIDNYDSSKLFYGYSIAIIDIDKLLEMTHLSDLESANYYYTLWKYNSDTSEREYIVTNNEDMSEQSINCELSVPGGTWNLSIVPMNGWISIPEFIFYVCIALIIALLFSFLCYYLVRSEKQKKELNKLAHIDPLTGLYNTRYMTITLERLKQEDKSFLLFVLDMNKFKQVNDTYGHKAGDALLTEAAARLKKCIRDVDYAFRIGGDEFCLIVVKDNTAPTGDELINKIKLAIKEPIKIDNIVLNMQTSCGYASYPEDSKEFTELVKIADSYMYEDKAKNE